METILNLSEEATPLPREVFDGERDLRWEPEPDGDYIRWNEVTGHPEPA